MATNTVVVLSDLHPGSVFGLLPQGFRTSDGRRLDLNPGQRYLLDCWNDMLSRVGRLPIDAVIVNGDVIEGEQRRQGNTESCLPVIVDQEEAAYELLYPLRRRFPKAAFYFIKGTPYHDLPLGQAADRLAERLDARPYAGLGSGRYAKMVLDLDVDGVVINVSHGISVATGFYRATPLDREGIWSALAGKEGKMPKADIVVRSHAHTFVHVEHASKHIIQTPCWELPTPYALKNSVYRNLPDIGFIVLEVSGSAKRAGDDPLVKLTKRIYGLPPYRATKLNGFRNQRKAKRIR